MANMKDRQQLHRARILSSVAATFVSLACGSNYVYSAWAPQFADRLKYSTTQSNLIGLAGNLGMYAFGMPVGILVDAKGPRPAALLGSIMLALGYFPLHLAYDKGSGSVALMCLYSFLSGLGGCTAFAAAVKTSALNWPHHRGTATAFPLAAFGLSAFFFSLIGGFLFPGDTGDFLLLLAYGTAGMTFLGFWFLRVIPHHGSYQSVAADEDEGKVRSDAPFVEPDIRGWQILRSLEFWQFFAIMGILAGIGLMTINNIGHSVQALWSHYDDSVSNDSLLKRQQLHVSILSVCSFSGRLLSGVGSDFLVKVLHASRVWCLVVAGFIFTVAQVCALDMVNPNLLGFVSGLSGLGYGFLFGVFPSIVAESFGIHGLSQNWGLMTMSPVVSGNVFNLFYGVVFDHHSVVGPNGERSCVEGLQCYRAAYLVTLASCIVGFVLTLFVIRHQSVQKQRDAKSKDGLED
ncbi:hypothetical protein FJTKL_12481 [Diaporthe vaccinii]|uniref:Nodulin-like domain-containing protein n=1 Tax=Diaporthe vaccinii TaxID=105482 RepID=A0ABR4EDF5_9PEZI